MRNRLLKVSAMVAIVAVSILAALLIPREPRYDGETLTYWMAHWYRGSYGSQALVDPSAKAAVREIGTNGLRYYIAWMGKPPRRSIDPDHQSWALHAFEVLGPTAEPAIPDLVRLLGVGGNRPALALAHIGKGSINALTNFLATNVTSNIRRANRRAPPWWAEYNAIQALRYMGTNAEPAIPCLINCLQGSSSRTQGEAASALADVGRNRQDLVVPVLVQALADTIGYPRASVAEALGTFGAGAKAAVPLLRSISDDQDPYARTRAAASLKQIAPDDPTALLPLIRNLTNQTVLVRQQALWALQSLNTNGLDALPVLSKASLRDPVAGVRTIAIGCLVRMGRCPDEALATLVENLTHPNEFVRSEAIGAIASFAAQSQPAFNALLKASRSQAREVRDQARNNVVVIGNRNPSLLVTSFDDPDPEVRSRAFQVLYFEVGVEPNTALNAVLKALHDPDKRVQEAAIHTLRKMDPAAAEEAGVSDRD